MKLRKFWFLIALCTMGLKVLLLDARVGLLNNTLWPFKFSWRYIHRKIRRVKYLITDMINFFKTLLYIHHRRPALQQKMWIAKFKSHHIYLMPAFMMFLLYRYGYFTTLHRLCVMLAYNSRSDTNQLHTLSLRYILKLYGARYSWSDEYDKYRKSGLFLDPKIITGADRYLGNIAVLHNRLKHWLAIAESADNPHDTLLDICIDAAMQLDDHVLFERLYDKFLAMDPAASDRQRWLIYDASFKLNIGTHAAVQEALTEIRSYFYYQQNYFYHQETNNYFENLHDINLYNRIPRSTAYDPIPVFPEYHLDYQYDIVIDQKVTPCKASLAYPNIAAHRLKKARIVHCHGLIINEDEVIERFVHLDDAYVNIFCPNMLVKASQKAIIATHKNYRHIPGQVFYCGYSDNYYHWLVECLPRYVLALELSESLSLPKCFIIPAALKNWQEAMLAAIGIEPEHCIIDARTEGFLCDEIIALDLLSFDMMSHPLTLEILKRRLPADWFEQDQPPSRKLMIARPKNHMRRLCNQNTVIKIVRKFGFEVVYPELLTFKEQIKLFGAATHVIGAGGAALANLMFTPPSCQILSFAPLDGHHPSTFTPLTAQQCGHVVYNLCESIYNVHLPPYIWAIFDYKVREDDLLLCLKQMGLR